MSRMFRIAVVLMMLGLLSLWSGCRKEPEATESGGGEAVTTPGGGEGSAAVAPDGAQTPDDEAGGEAKKPPRDTTRTAAEEPKDPRQSLPRAQEAPPQLPKPVQIPDDEWTMNYAAAVNKAKGQKKDLLMNFSGSDWCTWCIRLDQEVFAKEAFRNAASKQFVMVNLDYPNDKSGLPDEVLAQNRRLQGEYGIEGFPTVILADAQGRPYAVTGYQPGGVDAYLEHLKTLRGQGEKIQGLLKQAGQTQDAAARAQLLDQALSLVPPNLVFPFYRETAEKIVELDPDNQAGLKAKYQLALLLNKAQRAFERDDYAGAARTIDEAIESLDPQGEELQQLYFAKGQALHLKGDLEGAKLALEKALQAAPESPMAENIQRVLQTYFGSPRGTTVPAQLSTTLTPYQGYSAESAFDGDMNSFFWSNGGPKAGDTFTVVLAEPKKVDSVKAYTGAAESRLSYLQAGVLEVSEDGEQFTQAADFTDGVAEAQFTGGKTIKAIRIRATADQDQWLIVREIALGAAATSN